MGHSGVWGYLYNGQYFIIYDTLCLPEYTGKWLVSSVPSEPDAFKVWIAETKLFLDQVTDVDECEYDVPNVLSRTKRAPSTRLESGAHNDHSFLFDLDKLIFTMDERVHFPLDNLPPYDEWITYLAQDGSEYSCILPSTPDMYRDLVNRRMDPIRKLTSRENEDLTLYEETRPEIIGASSWGSETAPQWLTPARHLAKIAFTGFVSARYSIISNVKFQELVFEDLAMELLTAGAPAGSILTEDKHVVSDWIWKHQIKSSRDPEYARLRLSCGVEPPPKRTRCNAFWYRGRLIVLVRTLKIIKSHFQSKIGFVIRRAREKGLQECTAILWSIQHVAVVVVSGEKVSHSKVIPVVAAFRKEGAKCKRGFEKGVELLIHFLSPIASSGGFLSARLPLDSFIRIMDFTDKSTSAALGMTSKALRHEYLRYPWIGPFIVTGLCPNDEGFFARLGKTGRPFKITMRPFECLPYLDRAAVFRRLEDVKYVVYRLPFGFIDESYCNVSHFASETPDFSRVHGYEIHVEKKKDDGSFVRLPPKKVFKL
ncbi:hypothetical protein SCHPADRAFT_1002812 [Schizopora paradoxa]|uniref:Uncharacterized protein n=1 Tax=Schizopora paradoxa TaxID=27342 RepID=A0A0H2RLA7_9AGAM|nr:hypothetical protein SCHPADRAFT_1002812 [Schizopora paradoxa]